MTALHVMILGIFLLQTIIVGALGFAIYWQAQSRKVLEQGDE